MEENHLSHSACGDISTTSPPRQNKWFSKEETKRIQENLNRKLTVDEIRHRSAFNGVKLAYIEGWKAYSIANETFGFNGWSSEVISMAIDYVDEKDMRYSVGISCNVRVHLKDGTFHDDVGYGSSDNMRSKSEAFGKARKEAVTDATKRALRLFGNRLGNCMYDHDFLKNLYFQSQSTPHGSTAHSKAATSSISKTNSINANAPSVPSERTSLPHPSQLRSPNVHHIPKRELLPPGRSISNPPLPPPVSEHLPQQLQQVSIVEAPIVIAEDAYDEEGFIEDASLLETAMDIVHTNNHNNNQQQHHHIPW